MDTPCRHTTELRRFERNQQAQEVTFETKLSIFRMDPLDYLLDNADSIDKRDLIRVVANEMMDDYDRESVPALSGSAQIARAEILRWFDDCVQKVEL